MKTPITRKNTINHTLTNCRKLTELLGLKAAADALHMTPSGLANGLSGRGLREVYEIAAEHLLEKHTGQKACDRYFFLRLSPEQAAVVLPFLEFTRVQHTEV